MFFEIGVYHSKTQENIGTLWRSAYQLGAAGLFTIGKRYTQQPTDTPKVKRHLPIRNYLTLDDFKESRPLDALLVGIEMGGTPLREFVHPQQCVYLLGAEDHGLTKEVADYCDLIVSLESVRMESYNVAVAGSIVMYDRLFSGKRLYFKPP